MKMKKLLSALTAFCMGASMIASTLPASALTPVMNDSPVAQAGEYTWDLNDATVDADNFTCIEAYVTDDIGTNGYSVYIEIQDKDGTWKSLNEFGLAYLDASMGGAYPNLGTFIANPKESIVGATNNNPEDVKNNQYAVEGEPVFQLYYEVPSTIEDGVYNLRINEDETRIINTDNEKLSPVLSAGTLTIGDPEPEETTTTPEETAHTTTESSDVEEPPVTGEEYTWDLNDATVDSDNFTCIEAYVTNDIGTNGYSVYIEIQDKDGTWKSLNEFGLEYLDASMGGAYPNLGTFIANPNESIVGATNNNPDEVKNNQYAVEGEPVFQLYYEVPSTIEAGVYNLRINEDETRIINTDNEKLSPVLSAGTLTIGAETTTTESETTEETTTTSEEETSATTTTTSTETSASSDESTESEFVATSSEIDAEWIIGTVEAEPGETVTVPVTVKGDVDGINSYIADLGQDAGPVVQAAAAGDAYAGLGFESNMDTLTFGATNFSLGENVIAADGAVVFELTFNVPEDAAGTYDITFENLELYNVDMVQLIPKQTNGWIKVIVETESEFVATSSEIDAEWIIGTVEAEAGETVTVPVTVKGDVDGINSYIADLGQDAGPAAQGAEAGDAYASLAFESNIADLKFGGTNHSVSGNVIAEDNAVVFNVTFKVPDDAAAGTIYNITFEDLELYNSDMVQLIPKQTNGWIKIADDEFVEESSVIDAEWIIGTVEAEAGETVTVPVTVKGDVDGINSYILDMGQDAGPAAQGAEAGDAYAALSFEYNLDTLTFGATNFELAQNVVAADNAVVFNVSFTVPTDAAPGTVYDLVFEDLSLYNIDMVRLIPTQTDGWIKVKDAETTTTTGEAGEWIIGTVYAEAGETVTVPVTVKGDKNGINSYILDMGQDAGPVAQGAEAGDAYANLAFEYNLDGLKFAGTNHSVGENVIAADDAVVFNVTFKVPDDAAPGTLYNLTFDSLTVHDINMNTLTPTQTPGWIQIPDGTTTSTSTTTSTTTTTTTTTTTESETTTTTTSIEPNDAGEWIIGTTIVEAGATVTIPVTVKGDLNGINSYIFDMGQDAGPVAQGAEAGDAYAALGFEFNLDTLTFGATNFELAENVIAADGAVVLNVTFKVPDDAAPGTLYNLTFEGLTVYDINLNELTPTQTPGWIQIADESSTSTTETTTTTTESETTETTTTTESETTETTTTTTTTESETTTTTTSIEPNDAGEWIIGTTIVEAGATVTIPVTVKGDLNGINSYIFDMGQDAGPVAQGAEAGDAYAALGFEFNLDTLTFGATNFELAENVIAADGAVVLNVTFKVPDDAAPGTLYNLTFEGLTVYDINMNELTPTQTPGWIQIADESTTSTTETTTTTTETETTETTTTTTESETTETTTTTTESETTETTTTTTTESETTTTTSTSYGGVDSTDDNTDDTTTTTTETTTTTTESETTTTETTTTETSTETTTTTESEPIPGAATWQIGTVEAKAGETVTVDVTVYGDTGLNSYEFQMLQDAGPEAQAAAAGDAYASLAFEYALDTLTFGATGAEVTNVIAADGAVVLSVTFTVPEDAAEGTIYNLTFNGDVIAHNADMGTLDITEVPGWIKVLPADVTVTGYRYEVVGQSQFYFSHDPRPFDPADLVTSVMQYTQYSDGTESEGVEINVSEVKFDVAGWTNPEEVFKAQVLDEEGNPKSDYDVYYKGAIPATILDPAGVVQTIEGVGTAYIAVKGDATLTGEADAKDAANVLMYAAKVGANLPAFLYSETDAELEAFAYFLADVTGESEDNGVTDSLGNAGSGCDAKDAANILIYAAIEGSGKIPNWAEILNEPLPKYTAAIAAYLAANAG